MFELISFTEKALTLRTPRACRQAPLQRYRNCEVRELARHRSTALTLLVFLFRALSLASTAIPADTRGDRLDVATFGSRLLESRRIGHKNDNIALSPLSSYRILALLSVGTQGSTRSEILRLLGMNDAPTNVQELRRLHGRDHCSNAHVMHRTSLWAARKWALSPRFLRFVNKIGCISCQNIDFAASDAASRLAMGMKDWGKVNGFTFKLPGVDSGTTLLLLDECIVSAEWAKGADPRQTRPAGFQDEHGNETVCNQFRLAGEFGVCRNEKFDAVVIPLKDTELAVVFVLPQRGVTIEDADIQARKLKLWRGLDRFQRRPCVVKIPRFEIRADIDLIGAFREMGMSKAFRAGTGDFQPMFAVPAAGVFLQDAREALAVGVDEKGIYARAVTAAALSVESPLQTIINLNRPFLFAIWGGNEGSFLTYGAVCRPTSPTASETRSR
jgi:serine protease inhibitor